MFSYFLDKPVLLLPLLSYGMKGCPQNHYLLFKSFTGLLIKQFDDIYQTIESKIPNIITRLLSHRKDREREKERKSSGSSRKAV